MNEPAIEVSGLVKRFGSFTAVDDVGFSVGRGAIFGLLGANGAGKTTTIRILCGLMGAEGGSVILDGINVLSDPEAVKPRIGYMSQRFSLYRDLTVAENLEFFGGLYGVEAAGTGAGRRDILERVGLEDRERTLAGDLAAGVAQRLALACAMAHGPAVLFLDEPTAGVDPVSRRRFWDLIHGAAEVGTTVVVTTHYLDEAEYCDDIVLMHDGRIAASGGPEALKRNAIPGLVVEVTGITDAVLEKRLEREDWVTETSLFGEALHLQAARGVDEDEARKRIRAAARDEGCPAPGVESIIPSLEDVFLRVIDASGGAE